jgi:ferritin-like metal-binding protein YciE
MKNHSDNHKRFFELFVDELRAIYSAEKQIVEGLPKVINAATTKELKEALSKHLKETKNQVHRLEQIFSELGESPQGEFCEGLKGLLIECNEIIDRNDVDFVRDAALIGAAQKIEHYEIATYGTLKTFAKHLELANVEKLLQETLDEEGNANKTLTKIAEGSWISSGINAHAASR